MENFLFNHTTLDRKDHYFFPLNDGSLVSDSDEDSSLVGGVGLKTAGPVCFFLAVKRGAVLRFLFFGCRPLEAALEQPRTGSKPQPGFAQSGVGLARSELQPPELQLE
jgi:hypothetical protein